MSSSLYMMLFITATLPSLLVAFKHLYKKKPAEIKDEEMSHENNICNNPVLPVYDAGISEAQRLAITNKSTEKDRIFHNANGYTKNLKTGSAV